MEVIVEDKAAEVIKLLGMISKSNRGRTAGITVDIIIITAARGFFFRSLIAQVHKAINISNAGIVITFSFVLADKSCKMSKRQEML